jgi:hypothetical protein
MMEPGSNFNQQVGQVNFLFVVSNKLEGLESLQAGVSCEKAGLGSEKEAEGINNSLPHSGQAECWPAASGSALSFRPHWLQKIGYT